MLNKLKAKINERKIENILKAQIYSENLRFFLICKSY